MSLHRASLTSLLAIPLLLGGCSDRSAAAKAEPAAVGAMVQADGAEAPLEARAEETATDDAASQRMVIRTARLELRADDPAAVVRHAIAMTEQGGGFVSTSEGRGVGDEVDYAHATLRIPSDAFESLLQALRSEGELLSETLGGEDVTEEYVDLSARLRSQRTLEERLLTILSKVESVDDALSVETQLTRVRTEIERLDGQKRSLENRVSFATVDLVVSSPVRHNAPQAETISSRLDRALDDAGRAFVSVLAGMIRLLGVLLPLGLVFGPFAYAARRAWRRRKATRIASGYPAPIPGPVVPPSGGPAPPMPPRS